MKQSSLDIAMNICLNAIFEANIDKEDKDKILENIKLSFINYKEVSEVQKEQIERFNDELPKTR